MKRTMRRGVAAVLSLAVMAAGVQVAQAEESSLPSGWRDYEVTDLYPLMFEHAEDRQSAEWAELVDHAWEEHLRDVAALERTPPWGVVALGDLAFGSLTRGRRAELRGTLSEYFGADDARLLELNSGSYRGLQYLAERLEVAGRTRADWAAVWTTEGEQWRGAGLQELAEIIATVPEPADEQIGELLEHTWSARLSDPASRRAFAGGEHFVWWLKHLARAAATAERRAALLTSFLADPWDVGPIDGQLLGWSYKHAGELGEWRDLLDDQIAELGISGERRAGLLLARAFAEELRPTVWWTPRAGLSWAERALEEAESSAVRLAVVEYVVERHASVKEFEDGAAYLGEAAAHFSDPEDLDRLDELERSLSAGAEAWEQRRQELAAADAERRLLGRLAAFERRVAEAEARGAAPEDIASLQRVVGNLRSEAEGRGLLD